MREPTERILAGYLAEREMASIIDGIPGANLALYCPALHGRGATLYDRSQNANHGTITGATWTRLPSGIWTLSFDGTNDYISLATKPTAGAAALTELIWVKVTDKSRNHLLISDYVSDDDTSAALIISDVAATGTWKVSVGLRGATTAWSFASATTTTLAYGTWYLIGFTWDGATRTFYVNGAADGTAAYVDTALKTPTKNLTIGRYYPDTTQRLAGLAWMPLIKTALVSAAEMLRIYTRTRLLVGV